MNGLLIIFLSALVLAAGYFFYGRWIENAWGIDRATAPPAIRLRDRTDFIPTRSLTLLAQEFVAACAVLVIYGPIQAARWGWVPTLLWIVLGGILIGAVQEYCVLYVSVKSRGLTLGGLFGKFAGVRWKKVFLVFAWLVCVVTIAIFADIAAQALNGWISPEETDPVRGRAGTILLLLYSFALLAGLAGRYSKITTWGTRAIAVTILVCSIMLGLLFPVALQPSLWHIIILSLALLSAAGPVWLSVHPRGHLHTYLYAALLLLLMAGLVLGHRNMNIPAYTGFIAQGQTLYPWLFVILTTGAVSGLQALNASCVISRQVGKESRMYRVAFGGTMLVCFVAVVVLVCFGTQSDASVLSGSQSPETLFLSSMGSLLTRLGMSEDLSVSLYTLLIACLCIGGLETLARTARVCWQEFFDYSDEEPTPMQEAMTNAWLGGAVTLLAAFGLCKLGYSAILPLFGSAIQVLSALALLICAVWLRRNGRRGVWIWVPLLLMLSVALIAPISALIQGINAFRSGSARLVTGILQAVVAVGILAVLILLTIQGVRAFFRREEAPKE